LDGDGQFHVGSRADFIGADCIGCVGAKVSMIGPYEGPQSNSVPTEASKADDGDLAIELFAKWVLLYGGLIAIFYGWCWIQLLAWYIYTYDVIQTVDTIVLPMFLPVLAFFAAKVLWWVVMTPIQKIREAGPGVSRSIEMQVAEAKQRLQGAL